ncbi:DddA-like double-stranded DNA deaminase toxin [Allokutzneria sp. NRRL B-24872]|uniref:DddA-like double-stranded DNA deaminase toxin n=1 Tax=Allokutzneria sp. NRRL B-24872 TaxID=1137961 RepID=UPI00143DC649|nr:DddA-like double-stranded DNA deaminase toxin [Allokutzneria sp. NRRL B-24872]
MADLPLELVDIAENAIDETAILWDHATRGSPEPARIEVHSLLEAAKDDICGVRRLPRGLPALVESWIAGLGGDTGADQPLEPGWIARAAEVLSGLPPPMCNPRPLGQPVQPTHGRVLDENGSVVKALVSGTDEDSRAADGLLAEAGFSRLNIGLHVEVKALALMRETGRRHATIVINNECCGGPWGCAKMLPRLLRPGESLTVHGPGGYHRTFRRQMP